MLPSAIVVDAASPAGAVVRYAVSAIDLVDGGRPVSCDPASGATFPIGVTTVRYTVSDTRGNTAVGSFTVTVRSPAQMLANMIAQVTGID